VDKLRDYLMQRSGGLCEGTLPNGQRCGSPGGWRGLHQHEIIFRSQGGDPNDPDNVLLLCGKCHAQKHGLEGRR